MSTEDKSRQSLLTIFSAKFWECFVGTTWSSIFRPILIIDQAIEFV